MTLNFFLDLFTHYTKYYFNLFNGIKVILNECETNLTYLNLYRKNHFKQLLNSTFNVNKYSDLKSNKENNQNDEQSSISHNKSVVFNLIEQSIQAKAK